MAPHIPQPIVLLMASREWRMHHYIWHSVRNLWLFFNDAQRQTIRDLGWEPPRPATRPAPGNRRDPILDNLSGEDFLYMHRKMIAIVNAQLAQVADPSYPRVQGWPQIPRPADVDYPVPPAWLSGNAGLDTYLQNVKSDAFFAAQFLPWEQDYTDPVKLAGWTLGEFGSRLEFTIHNQLHMRFCAEPVTTGIRPDLDPTHPDTIDIRWDVPTYDWLGDTYSSHVNSVFWRLHGWVDDRIEAWKQAHHMVGEIPWQGTWIGKPMVHPNPASFVSILSAHEAHGHAGHGGGNMAEMEKIMKLLARSGHFGHFYDDIKFQK